MNLSMINEQAIYLSNLGSFFVLLYMTSYFCSYNSEACNHSHEMLFILLFLKHHLTI